ncbi:hypothetical protein AX15_001010 [Amanita polypyramis BW_CC]|nr:hypothetical protein AX15_001010 [Amanita polypyramis BW_CC]
MRTHDFPLHNRLRRRQLKNDTPTSVPTTNPSPTSSSQQPSPTVTTTAAVTTTTSVQITTSTTSTDGGLLGGLLGPPLTTSSSTTSSISSSSISSAIQTISSVSSIHTSSVSSATSSLMEPTYSVTITASTPSSTQETTNNDSGPIAGGVIGGLFAVAALGMFISFLLRRWRQKRIDEAIFNTTDFRRSAIVLEDTDSNSLTKNSFNPRPPTMIERRVAGSPAPGQRTFGGADPAMFTAPPAYAGAGGGYGVPGQPYYPPQSMQRGYYPQQGPERPYSPHVYVAQGQPTDSMGYPNPYGARAGTPMVPGPAARESIYSVSGHGHGDELQVGATMQRDVKTSVDSGPAL